MSIETLNLTPVLREYLLSTSLREPTVMRKLREETSKLKNFNMQIAPEQAQFMSLLARLMGAKKALELGTFTGYSALAIALALPLDGHLITCDVDPHATKIAKAYWLAAGMSQKIELKLAEALTTLNELITNGHAETFDFIFIDADKSNYLNYYEASLTLLRPGGLICIDNVLWSGEVANDANHEPGTVAIRALNNYVAKDDRVDISLLPLGDGLTLARKI